MTSSTDTPGIWKQDWDAARLALQDWWAGKGLALHVTAPADQPWEDLPAPEPTADVATRWLDPCYRLQSNLHRLSRTFFGGVAFPVFNADVGGPGSLGLFLGANGHPAPDTVWYEPCIADPDNHPALALDRECRAWRLHMAAIDQGLAYAPGRYLMGFPDLIENVDVLAQLRGSQETLTDMMDRPAWVEAKVWEINRAFYECYDAIYALIRDRWGGSAFNAFAIWGPGRTCKVQCDFSCMISPTMFRRFVQPALAEQCAWLDNALYHLDSTQALSQLDNLLSIESLQAIEWTPQAGIPGGGSAEWYDLYRRIKAGGKCVQAVGVAYDEVEPLLDAVGPEGMFVMTSASSEAEARALLERVGWKS